MQIFMSLAACVFFRLWRHSPQLFFLKQMVHEGKLSWQSHTSTQHFSQPARRRGVECSLADFSLLLFFTFCCWPLWDCLLHSLTYTCFREFSYTSFILWTVLSSLLYHVRSSNRKSVQCSNYIGWPDGLVGHRGHEVPLTCSSVSKINVFVFGPTL